MEKLNIPYKPTNPNNIKIHEHRLQIYTFMVTSVAVYCLFTATSCFGIETAFLW